MKLEMQDKSEGRGDERREVSIEEKPGVCSNPHAPKTSRVTQGM